jgi:hypothetical protein
LEYPLPLHRDPSFFPDSPLLLLHPTITLFSTAASGCLPLSHTTQPNLLSDHSFRTTLL